MKKKLLIIIAVCVSICAAFASNIPVSAATNNTSAFWKAALEGLYQCYMTSGVIRRDFGTIAANFTNWDRIIEKDKGEDFIDLPTGYTDLNDSNVSCKELIGGYGSGGNSFEGLFRLVGNRALPSSSSSVDAKKEFLIGMGYTEGPGGTSGKCVSFGYTRYKLGYDEDTTGRFNRNVAEESQVYSDSICISSVDSNDVIQSDTVQVMHGDTGLASSVIQFLEYQGGSGVKVFCYNGGVVCEDQFFTPGTTKFKDFAQQIYRYISVEAAGMGGAEPGGTFYQIRTDGQTCGTTGAVVCTDSGGVDVSYTFPGTEAAVNKAIVYITGGSYKDRNSLKFGAQEKVVLYQTYLADYFNSNVVCLEETAENENALANVQAQGYQKVRLYKSGAFDPNCWALAQSNANKVVTGIAAGDRFSALGAVTMTFTDIINALNGLIGVTSLNDFYAKELGELNVSVLPGDPANPPDATDPAEGEVVEEEPTCTGGAGAMGWVLCPAAEGMVEVSDGIYGAIQGLLNIDTKIIAPQDESGKDNAAFMVWEYFRDIANVLFIILMMIIIFSQLTGIGIDNYGIKKILPKLIITALLVNLSYIICQVAVDVSNILGTSLDNFLGSIGATVVERSGRSIGDYAEFTFAAVLTAIIGIAAGAVAVSGVVATGIVAATSGLSGVPLLVLLIPLIIVLIIAIISILMFFVTIALRQLLVILFVAISPLAFICYALPNTNPLFKKWWTVMKALLLVYPICGALYGFSQIIKAIAYTADGMHVFMVMIALVSSFVPFILLPTLLKKSMSAVGDIGARLSGVTSKIRAAGTRGEHRFRESGPYKTYQRRAAVNRANKLGGSKFQGFLGRHMPEYAADRQRTANAVVNSENARITKEYAEDFAGRDSGDVADMIEKARSSDDANMMEAAIADLAGRQDYDKITDALAKVDPSKMSKAMRDRISSSLITHKKGAAHLWGWSKQMKNGGTMAFEEYVRGMTAQRDASGQIMRNSAGEMQFTANSLKNSDGDDVSMHKDLAKEGDDLVSTQDKTSLESINKYTGNDGSLAFSDKQMLNAMGSIDKASSLTQYNDMIGGMEESAIHSMLSSMNAAQLAKMKGSTMDVITARLGDNLPNILNRAAVGRGDLIPQLQKSENASMVAGMNNDVRSQLGL